MKKILLIALLSLSLIANILNFKTIESNFIQKITDENNATITYKGKFYASSNSKALWIYNSPVEKKIYFNQKRVVIIEPELEQAIITTLQNSPNLTDIIKRAKKIKENLYKTDFDETNYYIKIKNGEIEKITYKDRLGNSIEIKLLNTNKNIILDDKVFKVEIPSYYDIISQ